MAIFMLLQANQPTPEKREQGPRPITVFVEPVERDQVTLEVVTQGEVRSRVSVDMVAEVSGRIMDVSPEFMEGGAFNPDATLVQIDDTDYQLALSQAEARVAEAQVALELALADADVARKQLIGTPNPSDLALKKPQVAEARAAVKAAEADLEQARVNLARTRVSLPFVGRMANTYVDLGQYVTAGTPLGRAFATDRVEVRLPITYDQLAALGLPIGFRANTGEGLPVTLEANVAGRNQQWRGELLRLDASIDRETRTLYAIAEVEDPYGANVSASGMPLAVGLYVTATVRGRELADAVRIPRKALRAGDTVYVINSDNELEIRAVTVSHSSPRHAIVEEGVKPGDRLIISTIRNPIPGMALKADGDAEALVSTTPADSGPG
ncbi:MAG: efflux RND transporter periplasmic adaptor subunit [Halieaceae bacterium]|nr:efflux RND transporter periplasmic adaptor subunit [Halieaceae bacterium]